MAGSLYIITTDQCNMDCKFCYTQFVPDFKEKTNSHINIDMAASIINIGNIKDGKPYDSIIFHGGEPLLYPKVINSIIDKIVYKPSIGIQTNLNHDLTKEQINLLIRLGGCGTSYSYDRFINNRKALKRFDHNIRFLKSLGLNIGVIVTLTKSHMDNCNPNTLYEYMEDLGVDDIIIERPSFPVKNIDKNKRYYQDLYNQCDIYMTVSVKLFDRNKLNLFNQMKDSIIYSKPYFPTKCSDFVFTLHNNELKYGCPSLESINIDNKKFMSNEKCLECYYYKSCQGDCECMNHICAFPIKLYDYVKSEVDKEMKESTNVKSPDAL